MRGRCYSGSMSRVAAAIFFILSGMFMSGMFITGWSFWYLSCGNLWTVSGFVWMWRPSSGSSFGALPVLGIAVLMTRLFLPPYRQHVEWSPIFWLYASQLLCLCIALALIIFTIRKTSAPNFTPWIISFSLVFGSFLVDWTFVARAATKSYRMNVAADGKGPSSLTGPPWDGPDSVVLYRNGHNGVVCFDAFNSKELHDLLLSKNGQSVTVEYDTFSDFGKVRGYNVHAVDGKILANGYHMVKPESAGSSGVASAGAGTASREDCW
jgi:hypothetical protein